LTGSAEIIRRDSVDSCAPPRMQPNETVHISRRVLLQHENSPTTCLQENLEGRLLHRGHRYEKNGYICSPVPPSFRHREQLPLGKSSGVGMVLERGWNGSRKTPPAMRTRSLLRARSE
jgi:hypothetical protein